MNFSREREEIMMFAVNSQQISVLLFILQNITKRQPSIPGNNSLFDNSRGVNSFKAFLFYCPSRLVWTVSKRKGIVFPYHTLG